MSIGRDIWTPALGIIQVRRLSDFRDRHEKIDKLRPIFPGMRRILDIFNEISGENGPISAFS